MPTDEQLRTRLTELAERYEPSPEAALVRLNAEVRPVPATSWWARRSWSLRVRLVVGGVCLLILLVGVVGAFGPWQHQVATPAQAPNGWTTLPASPLGPRHDAVGAWVGGRFLVIGGWNSEGCPPNASCAMPLHPPESDGAAYDPVTAVWSSIAKAPIPIGGGDAVVLGPDVYVSVSSGAGEDVPAILHYDSFNNLWSKLPLPPEPWFQLVAAGDRLLAVNRSDEQHDAVDAVLNPTTRTWTELPDDPLGPSFDRGGVWLGDRLLLTAHDLVDNPGSGKPSLTRMATLDADLQTWTVLPDSPIIGGFGVAAGARVVFPETGSANGGKVNGWGRSYPYGGIWNPPDGTWTDLPKRPALSRSSDLSGSPLAAAGGVLVDGHLLHPVDRTWTVVPRHPGSQVKSATVVAGDRTILVWGGTVSYEPGGQSDRGAPTATGYLYRF